MTQAGWEHAADGIRLNPVGPGSIRTPLVVSRLTEEQTAGVEQEREVNP